MIAFINGRIYTSFVPVKSVEAMVVDSGKIVYLGDNITARQYNNVTKIIDLHNRTVLPGFIDAHMHLEELGEHLNTLNLRNTRSIKELKQKLKQKADNTETDWIIGHGWDQDLFEEQRWPTRYDLDSVVPDKPVFLSRICLHAAVLNTRAMKILKLLDNKSKYVIRDKNNKVVGVIKETAFANARAKLRMTMSRAQLKKYVIDGMYECLKKGVTTVGFVSCSAEVLDILKQLREDKMLKLRCRVYVNSNVLEYISDFVNTDLLRVNGIKLFIDGSLGARTAWLSSPYADAQDTSGGPVITSTEYFNICKQADEYGLHIATHAIGDKALDIVLDTYSKLTRAHRVEHASLIRPDQFIKLKAINTTIVTQPHFIIDDFWTIKRVGSARATYAYPFKKLVEHNIPIAFSTDAPIEPVDPWQTVYAAVTRGEFEHIELFKYTRNQALELRKTLDIYTAGSARALQDTDIGRLEVGKYADFIIVNKDPFTINQNELKTIKVLETYVGGIVV